MGGLLTFQVICIMYIVHCTVCTHMFTCTRSQEINCSWDFFGKEEYNQILDDNMVLFRKKNHLPPTSTWCNWVIWHQGQWWWGGGGGSGNQLMLNVFWRRLREDPSRSSCCSCSNCTVYDREVMREGVMWQVYLTLPMARPLHFPSPPLLSSSFPQYVQWVPLPSSTLLFLSLSLSLSGQQPLSPPPLLYLIYKIYNRPWVGGASDHGRYLEITTVSSSYGGRKPLSQIWPLLISHS